MTSTRILPAAVIAALVALNWYAAQRPIDIAPIAPTDTTSNALGHDRTSERMAEAASVDAPEAAPADNAFQERPLFNPTRRPREEQPPGPEAVASVVEEPEPATSPTDQSGLRLIGVMQIGRDNRRALIRAANTPNGLWLAAGGEVDGWRVSAIEAETVVVAKSGSSEQLVLRRSDTAGAQ